MRTRKYLGKSGRTKKIRGGMKSRSNQHNKHYKEDLAKEFKNREARASARKYLIRKAYGSDSDYDDVPDDELRDRLYMNLKNKNYPKITRARVTYHKNGEIVRVPLSPRPRSSLGSSPESPSARASSESPRSRAFSLSSEE